MILLSSEVLWVSYHSFSVKESGIALFFLVELYVLVETVLWTTFLFILELGFQGKTPSDYLNIELNVAVHEAKLFWISVVYTA